jgi:hypothetical protein
MDTGSRGNISRGLTDMGNVTVYKVRLTGEVNVQAANEADAKTEALAKFAESPQSYVAIAETTTVIVPE